jgi:hypothetical protein
MFESKLVVAEIGPIGLLPYPSHGVILALFHAILWYIYGVIIARNNAILDQILASERRLENTIDDAEYTIN